LGADQVKAKEGQSRRVWLMKTEPDVFSFEDLLRAPRQTTCWEGVRNYQARNFMRDDFKVGDLALIYHSSTAEPGIAGIAEVVRGAYPDPSALDPKSEYFDEASKKSGESRWVMVDVRARSAVSFLSLSQIRSEKKLATMPLLQKGQRLSIQPVTPAEWKVLESLLKPSKI
jgi:predicted RNA-binding protein with PUA-like domain